MIKFFRKIRFDLMEKNKAGKYLKYAIGEIVLVVIGILIALSINNWNENRKRQNEEVFLLIDIKKNLETMLMDFTSDTIYNSNGIVQYGKIEHYIANDLPYSNELDSVFGILTFWSSPYITATAYNSLQNKGLDLIKNEELKNNLIKLYEVELQRLIEDYTAGENQLGNVVVEPYIVKKVKRLHNQSLRLARPSDFESLKKDVEFTNILSHIIRQRKRGIEIYKDVMSKMKISIDDIDKELKKRKHNNGYK
ncbi:DUF6090 family protein [Flavobacteriaceae bacterium S0862]|nr:DUF6090 family protein [Flavobacteriaceae bacterium S0862]